MFVGGLVLTIFGICLMVYSAIPLYQANYAVHYNSMAERCNGTDPYLHPELGSASWVMLTSSFPVCIGLTLTVMGKYGSE